MRMMMIEDEGDGNIVDTVQETCLRLCESSK